MEELAWIRDQAGGWWEFLVANSQVLNHLALIVAGVVGIPLLWIRTRAPDAQAKAANAQARTAEQGHITDRFTKTIEQLGSDKMAVRLGAIYAFERISRDSPRDHWAIMETLTAYVRENAPWPRGEAPAHPFAQLQGSDGDETDGATVLGQEPKEGAEPLEADTRPATDIQAILTVLGQRDEETCDREEAAGRCLNLEATDLQGADLFEAALQHADLRAANLKVANLWGANVWGADLRGANLRSRNLMRSR